ncbi:MAG: inositol monophosphatase family protein [Clostridia bacterium]|nr:inositol monophosphatase family protein [Clostridia bacterium]
MENFEKDLNFLINLVKEASLIIKNEKMEVFDKNVNDIVTNLDLKVEKYIIENLKGSYKEFEIISEEFNPKSEISDNYFTIDPIDGTMNFANNLKEWSIQIAMVKDKKNYISIMYFPILDELFYCVKGRGVYLNNKQIFDTKTISNKRIFTVDAGPHNRYKIAEEIDDKLGRIRAYGCVSYSYANLIKRNLSGIIFLSKTKWDIMPGLIMCKELGLKIFENEKYFIASINEEILQELINIVKKHYID